MKRCGEDRSFEEDWGWWSRIGNGHRGFLLRIIPRPTAIICPRQEKNPWIPAASAMLENSSWRGREETSSAAMKIMNPNNISGMETEGDILVSIHGVYAWSIFKRQESKAWRWRLEDNLWSCQYEFVLWHVAFGTSRGFGSSILTILAFPILRVKHRGEGSETNSRRVLCIVWL